MSVKSRPPTFPPGTAASKDGKWRNRLPQMMCYRRCRYRPVERRFVAHTCFAKGMCAGNHPRWAFYEGVR